MKRIPAALALLAGLVSPTALTPGCAFSKLEVATCGGFDDVEPACDACGKASCCAQGEACRASAPCSALFDCLKMCGADADCRTACAVAHPSDEAAAALSRCRMEICQDDCTSCGGYFHVESSACDDCTRTHCCDVATACLADEDCEGFNHCVNNCNHPRCGFLCRAEHGAPSERMVALSECVTTLCRTECELGQRFDCVDGFDYPPPLSDTLTYTTTLFRITSGEPLAGATFRACNRIDDTCSEPVAETTLDDTGTGTVTLPGGFDSYFETSGIDDVPGDLRFNAAPLLTDEVWDFGLFARETLDDAHALLGTTWRPDRGLLLAFPKDCDETESPGIRLELEGPGLDEHVLRFYIQDGFPNPNLTETNPGTNQGGGFANVPPGLFTVRAIQASTEREVATEQVLIRAGWNTVVHVLPAP